MVNKIGYKPEPSLTPNLVIMDQISWFY